MLLKVISILIWSTCSKGSFRSEEIFFFESCFHFSSLLTEFKARGPDLWLSLALQNKFQVTSEEFSFFYCSGDLLCCVPLFLSTVRTWIIMMYRTWQGYIVGADEKLFRKSLSRWKMLFNPSNRSGLWYGIEKNVKRSIAGWQSYRMSLPFIVGERLVRSFYTEVVLVPQIFLQSW